MSDRTAQNEYLFDAMLRAAVGQVAEEEIEALRLAASQEKHIFSERHNRKIRAILRRHRWKTRLCQALPAAKRAAVIALVISAISFGALMTAAAVRNEVIRAVTQWFDKFTNVGFTHEETRQQGQEIDLRKSGMMLPGYIPEGYTLTEESWTSMDLFALYEDEKDHKIIYEQLLYDGESTVSIDNEHHTFTEVTINGVTGILAESTELNAESSILLWTDGMYEYRLIGDVDTQTIWTMAESLQPAIKNISK